MLGRCCDMSGGRRRPPSRPNPRPIGRSTLSLKKDQHPLTRPTAPIHPPAAEAPATQSNHVKRKLKARTAGHKLDSNMDDQFAVGRLYACISSRPGQVCGDEGGVGWGGVA